jgi:hypothetical protein
VECLRFRSAPWDDVIDTPDIASPPASDIESIDDDLFSVLSEPVPESPMVNVFGAPPAPTHYQPLQLDHTTPEIPLPDPTAHAILQTGVHLPPPLHAPTVFNATRPTPLLQEVVHYLLQKRILIPYKDIRYAFRLFLVAKPSGSARPVVDLSAWTPIYSPPPIRLYSVADVLSTIPHQAKMIKLDLLAGFFQIPLHPDYFRYYGSLYAGQLKLIVMIWIGFYLH